MAIEPLLAALRLSRFDPTMFAEFLPALLEVLPEVPESMRAEVARVLTRIQDNWFPIGENVDMELCLGLAFSALGHHAQALDCLAVSVAEHPDNAQAAFATAIARRGLGQFEAALEWAERAVALEPAFSEAKALRAVLWSDIGDGMER